MILFTELCKYPFAKHPYLASGEKDVIVAPLASTTSIGMRLSKDDTSKEVGEFPELATSQFGKDVVITILYKACANILIFLVYFHFFCAHTLLI